MSENQKAKEEQVSKFGKQEVQEIENIKYTFQFPGTKKTQEILDEAAKGGNFSNTKYHEDIMEHVIVKPIGVNWDYWDEHEGYREVMALADNFLGRQL
ncbi:hypothetical protein ACQKIC_16415 [Peribacillus sp. NPDC046944]|uniref:hypothetical protein n=1 Tax=unclassified Peribacillus TaxID=2675266 RepID=UPI003CFF0B0E